MRFCMGEITDYFSWKNFHIGLEKNFRVEVGGVHRVFKTFMRSNGLYNRINISIDGEGRVYRLSSSNYLRICCEIIVILNIVSISYNRASHFILSSECTKVLLKIRAFARNGCFTVSNFRSFKLVNGDVFVQFVRIENFHLCSEALLFFFFFLNIRIDMLNLELLKNKWRQRNITPERFVIACVISFFRETKKCSWRRTKLSWSWLQCDVKYRFNLKIFKFRSKICKESSLNYRVVM